MTSLQVPNLVSLPGTLDALTLLRPHSTFSSSLGAAFSMEDSDHASHLQCGGPCLHRHSAVCSKPSAKDALLTPYTMGNFKLCTRMVYAPLTRCRALGEYTPELAA